jgi:hypothetical protein
MEKLKYSIFDLFVYMVPGVWVLFSVYLSCRGSENSLTIPAVLLDLKEMNIYGSFITIVLAYCTGFITSALGKYYQSLKDYLVPLKLTGLLSMRNSEKYVLVREKSRENFKYIEQWNVLKNFSTNMAFCVLVSSTMLFIRVKSFSLVLFLSGIVISVLLLFESTKYKRWGAIDLDNAAKLCQNAT